MWHFVHLRTIAGKFKRNSTSHEYLRLQILLSKWNLYSLVTYTRWCIGTNLYTCNILGTHMSTGHILVLNICAIWRRFVVYVSFANDKRTKSRKTFMKNWQSFGRIFFYHEFVCTKHICMHYSIFAMNHKAIWLHCFLVYTDRGI